MRRFGMYETLDLPERDPEGLADLPLEDGSQKATDPRLAVELFLGERPASPAPKVALLSDEDAFRFERPEGASEEATIDSQRELRSAEVIPFRPKSSSA